MAKLGLLCLLLACLLTGCAENQEVTASTRGAEPLRMETVPETTEAATQPATEVTEPEEERFWLTFVGDCTFGCTPTNAYAEVGFLKTVGEDYRYPFANVIDYLEGDEFTMVNLEGPLSDTGNPMQKKHVFRGPTAYGKILTENSVEAVTLANNHAMDYGQTGYDATVDTLNRLGVPYVERDATTVVTTRNGLTIGIYGAVYYALDVEDMEQQIAALKEQGCDLVIYAPHWGTEGSYHPTAQQTRIGYAAIEAGADIVYGSHPHVLQPMERYVDGVIFYSLGNFCFGGNGYPRDYDTALVQQEVIRDSQGQITLGQTRIVPASVSSVSGRNNYQPTPYEPGSEAYDRVLAKLDGSFSGPNLKIQ